MNAGQDPRNTLCFLSLNIHSTLSALADCGEIEPEIGAGAGTCLVVLALVNGPNICISDPRYKQRQGFLGDWVLEESHFGNSIKLALTKSSRSRSTLPATGCRLHADWRTQVRHICREGHCDRSPLSDQVTLPPT